MRYSFSKNMLYYFQMKIFKNRKKKKEIKDDYQKVVEKFGTEQLRRLEALGLRLPVMML